MFAYRRAAAALPALLLLLCLGTATSRALAAGQDRTITVRQVAFKPGASSVGYSGTVRGYDSVRYEMMGRAGQRVTVRLTSASTFLYFNLVNARTGTALEATPAAPREVTAWTGALPEDGLYYVEVYLVRAEARRGGRANFKLSLSVGGTTSTAAAAASASGRPVMDYETGGTGQYVVEGNPPVPVRKVRVILKPDQSAEIRVDLGGDGFTVSGKWRREGTNRVAVDITRGLGDSSLTGGAGLTLRGVAGTAREWDTMTMNFDFPRQNTKHRLTYRAAKG